MRGKYLRKFGGLILATLLLPGVVALLSSTTAQAQRRVVIVRTYRPYYRPYYYDPFWPYWSAGWWYGGPRYVVVQPSPGPAPPPPGPWPHRH